jgi:hypothetical protein
MSKRILKKQERLNDELGIVLSEDGISNLRLINVGNSIASGFSYRRLTKPLFLRNETLRDKLNNHGVELDYHHFARPQNNNDEHILEWFVDNISERSIALMNRNDYLDGKTSLFPSGITEKEVDKYFPYEDDKNFRIMDLIRESSDDMANIVVYNGCTGSFLNGNRYGRFLQKFFYGIRRDVTSIEAILKMIQTNNRMNDSNTQVFLCGVPNLMGVGISNCMNTRLKGLEEKYANVVYVPPVVASVFYKPLDPKTPHEIIRDVHYDEDEYLRLLNNIIASIKNNYLTSKAMIDLDRRMYRLSENLEFVDKDNIDNKDFIEEYIGTVLEEETRSMTSEQKRAFLARAKKYLLERYPYDFSYLGKDSIKKVMDSGIQKAKKREEK